MSSSRVLSYVGVAVSVCSAIVVALQADPAHLPFHLTMSALAAIGAGLAALGKSLAPEVKQ